MRRQALQYPSYEAVQPFLLTWINSHANSACPWPQTSLCRFGCKNRERDFTGSVDPACASMTPSGKSRRFADRRSRDQSCESHRADLCFLRAPFPPPPFTRFSLPADAGAGCVGGLGIQHIRGTLRHGPGRERGDHGHGDNCVIALQQHGREPCDARRGPNDLATCEDRARLLSTWWLPLRFVLQRCCRRVLFRFELAADAPCRTARAVRCAGAGCARTTLPATDRLTPDRGAQASPRTRVDLARSSCGRHAPDDCLPPDGAVRESP